MTLGDASGGSRAGVDDAMSSDEGLRSRFLGDTSGSMGVEEVEAVEREVMRVPEHLAHLRAGAAKAVEGTVDVSGIDWKAPAIEVHDELVERYLSVYPDEERDELVQDRAQRFAERVVARRLE